MLQVSTLLEILVDYLLPPVASSSHTSVSTLLEILGKRWSTQLPIRDRTRVVSTLLEILAATAH